MHTLFTLIKVIYTHIV